MHFFSDVSRWRRGIFAWISCFFSLCAPKRFGSFSKGQTSFIPDKRSFFFIVAAGFIVGQWATPMKYSFIKRAEEDWSAESRCKFADDEARKNASRLPFYDANKVVTVRNLGGLCTRRNIRHHWRCIIPYSSLPLLLLWSCRRRIVVFRVLGARPTVKNCCNRPNRQASSSLLRPSFDYKRIKPNLSTGFVFLKKYKLRGKFLPNWSVKLCQIKSSLWLVFQTVKLKSWKITRIISNWICFKKI